MAVRKRYKIQHRTDTAENWARFNPILILGEIGCIQGSNMAEYKVGDGVHHWNDLPTFKNWDGTIGGTGGEIPDMSGYATKEELSQKADKSEIPSIEGLATETFVMEEISKAQFEGGGTSGDTTYHSAIVDKAMKMPNSVGGIAKGTDVQTLEGKQLSALWDDLLFPTILPTFQNPSANLKYNGSLVQEVHATAPSESGFETTFNKGKILINGEFADDRSGELISSQSFIHMKGISTQQSLPSKIALGENTYQYKAFYGQGPQPKDNKGNPCLSPLPSGSVESNVVTINGTYPFFASTSVSGAVKQPLVKWANSMTVEVKNLQPSAQVAQCFKVPREAKKVYQLNTLNHQYELSSLSLYDKTTETINVNGEQKTYHVYTYNGAPRGEVSLKIEF